MFVEYSDDKDAAVQFGKLTIVLPWSKSVMRVNFFGGVDALRCDLDL